MCHFRDLAISKTRIVSSLEKRIAYLGIADFDYLSARLLLLNGLVTTALPKAAEAFEKLLKLFLVLEAAISRREAVTTKQLKAYSHNLSALFTVFKERVPAKFDETWDDYFGALEESYKRRYPEDWKRFRVEADVHKLDMAYTFLRNNVVQNFPSEEHARVRQFGTFIYDAYNGDVRAVIANLGGRPPGEVLRDRNESFANLDIDASRL